jgi:flagellin
MTTINTNIQSINAQRNLAASQSSLSTSMQRLSSGLRINSAKDDAAGLAISERMNSQVKGLNVAVRNANDGISLTQTAEGALGEIGNNLQRIRELSVQSANATNSSSDREAMQAEVNQLVSEIDRVATQTDFNGTRLLDGSFSGAKGEFQVGANAGQTIKLDTISSARANALGQYQGFSLQTQAIGIATNTTAAQTVTVNGAAPIALGTIANDAKALASAINSQGISGMRASANETVFAAGASAITATANGTSTINLNGITISLPGSGNASGNRATAQEAINAQSAATGVRAVDTGAGLELRAGDGRNISVSGFSAGGNTSATQADFGIAADSVAGGTLNIDYSAPKGTSGSVVFGGAFANTSLIAATGVAVSAIDITTAAGASKALASLDSALQSINSSRGDLGAVQNRFSSVITNLQTNAENLSSARARIVDADFAKETSNLSRAQILQQAGTAMVAQANQLPQGVLSLLR